jgi:ABC-type phosphate/phosphonate transport system substrate-binding protein
VVEAGFHQRALRMVAAGEVDGSAIDCQVLAVELDRHPELSGRVRVVATLGPAPSQPVVVRSSLGPELKDLIRRRLIELRDPILNAYGVERFAPAPDYSAIAAVVGVAPGLVGGPGG